MYFRSFAVLALGSIALGQTVPASSPTTPPNLSRQASGVRRASPAPSPVGGQVGPNDPVITIQGICDTTASSKIAKLPSGNATAAPKKPVPDCKTVITRAQFESLAAALQPDMNSATKRKLAELYPTMIIMSHTAEQRGYQNSPQFKQLLEFARIQTLATQLNRAVEKEAKRVSPSDVEKYYNDNPAAFEEVSVERIFVPRVKLKQHANGKAGAGPATEAEKSDEEAMKKEADDLEKRAAAGEEFDKLQKEAFELAGLSPPATSANVKLTVSEMPEAQRKVRDLKAGEVSQVFSESNGYFIYKFLSRGQRPLDDKTREDIESKLAQQRFQQTMDQLHKPFAATLNDAYFAEETAQARPNHPMPSPRGFPPAGMVTSTTTSVAAPPSAVAPVTSPVPHGHSEPPQ